MLAAVLAVVVLLREVLLPFVAGATLAYLLDPLATRLERLGMNCLVATLMIVGLFIGSVVALAFLTAPFVVNELGSFIDNFPLYLGQLRQLATDPNRPWLSKIVGEGLGQAQQSIDALTALATDWFGAFLRSLWSGGRAMVSILSLSVVTPVVACYLIHDWNKMIAAIDNWVPPMYRDTIWGLAREIDDTVSGYVIGQGSLCLILALYYSMALLLTGLKHAFLIGTIAGLISFVPYLGSLIGIVVSTSVAIPQFWPNLIHILIVPTIFFIGQLLADYLLSPYLVARRLNLNPVWVIFSLFAFGYLFGFVGLLIALPLAASIGVILRFALKNYYASPLYSVAPPTNTTDVVSRAPPID